MTSGTTPEPPGRPLGNPLLYPGGRSARPDELFAELTYHADPQRAIRTCRHKLIRHYGDRLEQVLSNDPLLDGPVAPPPGAARQ